MHSSDSHIRPQNLPYLFGYKAGDYHLVLKNPQTYTSLFLNFSYVTSLFQNIPKNLDPSYIMEIDFFNCFGRKDL